MNTSRSGPRNARESWWRVVLRWLPPTVILAALAVVVANFGPVSVHMTVSRVEIPSRAPRYKIVLVERLPAEATLELFVELCQAELVGNIGGFVSIPIILAGFADVPSSLIPTYVGTAILSWEGKSGSRVRGQVLFGDRSPRSGGIPSVSTITLQRFERNAVEPVYIIVDPPRIGRYLFRVVAEGGNLNVPLAVRGWRFRKTTPLYEFFVGPGEKIKSGSVRTYEFRCE